MLSVPSEPWIAGWRALIPISPPLEGLSPMDCAGAVSLWCDFAGQQTQSQAGSRQSMSHQAVQQMCADHFGEAGADYDIYEVTEHRRLSPDLPEPSDSPGPSESPEQSQPLGEPSPGFVWFTFMRRLAGLPHQQFVRRWCEGHWPLVKVHHPGLWGYTQNVVDSSWSSHASAGVGARADSGWNKTPKWDGIGELQFRTPADMRDRMYDSDAGRQIIWDDIAGFLDTAAGQRFYAQEIWLKQPDWNNATSD